MFDFQKLAVDKVVGIKRIAVFIKMGLGKTCVTLTALSDLEALEHGNVLVVAPAAVVERGVWTREAQAWEHTKHLPVVSIIGSAAERRKALVSDQNRIEVISYESLLWLIDEIDPAERYCALVFDELSKMKKAGTKRFKRLRYQLEDVQIKIGLTGSPVGNHLLDIWGEMFAACGPAALGSTFIGFRNEYFCPIDPSVPRHMMTFTLKHPSCAQAIYDRIKPHAFSLDESVAAGKLPKLKFTSVDLILPKNVQRMEEVLAAECKVELAKGISLEVFSKSSLAGKARQFASGAVYYEDAEAELAKLLSPGVIEKLRPKPKEWIELHDVKIKALQEILDEQQGEPVLCFYWFQHELARLQKAFPEARLATDQSALDAWDRREVPLMLAHPQSAGHGLNLQAGGSTIVWFALPWSFEAFEQSIARLARTGQKASFVTVIALLAGKADTNVWEVLQVKGGVQRGLMDALRLYRVEDDPLLQ